MSSYMVEHLPQLKIILLEGTYLVWADCRELELNAVARKELLMQEARIFLDEGELFGQRGEKVSSGSILPSPIRFSKRRWSGSGWLSTVRTQETYDRTGINDEAGIC